MATNNACNFALGTIGQVLTMTSSTVMAFQNASNRSQSSASRSLNTIFQVSSTRDSTISYSINISCTLSLTGGQTGTIFLEMSPSATFASGIQELARFVNANTGTLTIGLNITQTSTACVTGYVPVGNYVRIRSDNTVGTPTFSYQSGQEVLL